MRTLRLESDLWPSSSQLWYFFFFLRGTRAVITEGAFVFFLFIITSLQRSYTGPLIRIRIVHVAVFDANLSVPATNAVYSTAQTTNTYGKKREREQKKKGQG